MMLFNSKTNSWLSNMHACKVPVRINDQTWWFPSVENAYQFAKTNNRNPDAINRWIALNPFEAKRQGKQHFSVDWDEKKLRIMELLCRRKFTANPNLRERLLLTFDEELEHLSPWDLYWGTDADGKGENHLGKIIMKLRDERSLFEKDW